MAHDSRIRFLPRVCSHVHLEGLFLRVALATQGTLPWLLPLMAGNVASKISSCGESRGTFGTLKRPVPRVGSHVGCSGKVHLMQEFNVKSYN